MNARYALINATTPRIVRRSTSVDGGREKKREGKEKGEKKSKKRQAGKKNGTNGSLNNFFERWGADKVSPRGAIAGQDRQLSLLLLIRARGRAYLRERHPFSLSTCLVALSRFLFPSGSQNISVSRSCHVRQKLAGFLETISPRDFQFW